MRSYLVAKIVLLAAGVLLGLAVWVPPPNPVSDGPLGAAAVEILMAYPIITTFLVVTLPFLGLAVLVFLASRRRSWIIPVLRAYARFFFLLLIPIGGMAVAIFYAGAAAVLVATAVAAWVVLRRARPASRLRDPHGLVNLVILACAASYLPSAWGLASDAALRDEWRAVRYSSEKNAYDATFAGPAGDLYVGVGYGGGLLRIAGAGDAARVVGAVRGLRRPERLVVVDGRVIVSNNTAGNPGEPDAVSVAPTDLADRRDILSPSASWVIDLSADPAARRLFFIDERHPGLTVWNLERREEEKDILLERRGPINPHDVVFDPVSRKVLVCCWFRGRKLYVIDADRLEVERKVPVGASATAVQVAPEQARVYVARPLHRRVDIYDTRDWQRVGAIRTVPGARQMIRVPRANLLVVGSYFTAELEAIRIDDPSRRVRIRAFPRVRGLTYDEARDEILVCCRRGVFGLPLAEIERRLGERP